MFQMSEGGAEVSLTRQFLQSCLSNLPAGGSPQMRLQTQSSLARLSEPETKLNIKNNEPRTCTHCYTPVNLQRASIRLQNVRKSLTMNIDCHICRKETTREEICFSKLEPHQKTKTRQEEDENRQKTKKRKGKKDKNAGLNLPLPSVSHHSKAPTVKMKTVNSQNKLKYLLAKDTSSKMSSLQDFLKKL